MTKAISALFFLALGAYGSIRDVDFKDFTYPFIKSKFVSVPGHLRWMPRTKASYLSLRDGEYRFPCDLPVSYGCPSAGLNKVDFGNIDGLPDTSAFVTVWYSTGGTANWQYLYVIALRSGKPEVVAWLETGSRAYIGLRSATVERGDLVLIVNDPDKRQGDCCSTGTITYRYRWHAGSFHKIGTPVLKDDPQ
jgi:hypothetical protein